MVEYYDEKPMFAMKVYEPWKHFFLDEQCPSCMNMELSSAYRQEAAVQGWRREG